MASLRAVNAANGHVLPTRAAGPRSRTLCHIAGSKRRSLLMAGDDDEMFMTRSLNVTPKITEQHLIARSDCSMKSAIFGTLKMNKMPIAVM